MNTDFRTKEMASQETRWPVHNAKLHYPFQIIIITLTLMLFAAPAIEVAAAIPAYPEVRGRIVDSVGRPLAGASVRTMNAEGKRTALQTKTDRDGYFLLRGVPEDAMLEVSYVGYIPQTAKPQADIGSLVLSAIPAALEEVEVIINTGYESIAKERATGSFVHVDNALFESRVGKTVLERLDGVAPGLQFDKRTPETFLHVRGLSTFRTPIANQALVVLDNFVYEGNLDNINPNDVESVTLLKDAAATSIWGVKAGNGVVVINTKKAEASERIAIAFQANRTIGSAPNLMDYSKINSSDFIDLEIDLYKQGFYAANLARPDQRLLVYSPVVSLLYQAAQGEISDADATQRIDGMRNHDYRREIMDNAYRNSSNQQYALSLSGGNEVASYLVSTAYNHQQSNVRNSGGSGRFNLRGVTTLKPIENLEIRSTIQYTQHAELKNSDYDFTYPLTPNLASYSALYPYARLMDEQGSPLAIPYGYNPLFVDTAGQGRLLDWTYRPLKTDDATWVNDDKRQHINLGARIDYKFMDGLSVEVHYNYEREMAVDKIHHGLNDFATRDLINLFTQIRGQTLFYPVPMGGTLENITENMFSHRGRGQLNFRRSFADRHQVVALFGGEISHMQRERYAFKKYGYNDETFQVGNDIDVMNTYPVFGAISGNRRLGAGYGPLAGSDFRFLSFYGNASYAYDRRYMASFSARQDASNVFGALANRNWNPLWSAGLSWNLHEELFMEGVHWVDQLKLRTTYGHSGNTGSGAVARAMLMTRSIGNLYPNLPYASINRPANPNLKWEDIQMTNFGVDFSLFKNGLSGSLEYFTRKSTDLISALTPDMTSGISTINANVGEMVGKGLDVNLQAQSRFGRFRWIKHFTLSYAQNTVTKVQAGNPMIPVLISNAHSVTGLFPLEGKSLYPMYSFGFAGLDGGDGRPIGYFKGEPSMDYTNITVNTKLEDAVYHGTALPPYFGFFRNTFGYRGVQLTLNFSYKFGHYFRRSTFNGTIASWDSHGDYYKRWQKPGDEMDTTIPAYFYPLIPNMNNFYMRSEATVDKGDVIRLQDIRVDYRVPMPHRKGLPKALQVYATGSNIALVWKASKAVLDPEMDIRAPRFVSVGINGTF